MHFLADFFFKKFLHSVEIATPAIFFFLFLCLVVIRDHAKCCNIVGIIIGC